MGTVYETIDQYALFCRRNFGYGNECRFWVGVSGKSADDFVPEQLWVVQGEEELGLSLKGEFDVATRLGTMSDLASQFLVVFGDELDATLPMRVIYISSIGPVSAAYRLDSYYR